MLSFDRFLLPGEGRIYYKFSNTDGKTWLIPRRNMAVAMCLYQPSSGKGKLLKRGLPYLHGVKLVRDLLHIESGNYVLSPWLQTLLEQAFGEKGLDFSVFGGTPCVHQKITIQLSKGKRILGYCKVTDTDEISRIFAREQALLDLLEEKGVSRIPRCLYCGSPADGISLFVQTTTKNFHSGTDHELCEREENFLKELHEKTKRSLPFEQTEFCEDIRSLREYPDSFAAPDFAVIEKGMRLVMSRFQGREVEFSCYHADFTPWNMYVEQGALFVFDFEYAKCSYPPFLDYFHFFTQTAILEKHLLTEQIWVLYRKERENMHRFIQDTDFAYVCYLLGVMAHYVKREKGIYNDTVSRFMKTGIGLLDHLCREKSYL